MSELTQEQIQLLNRMLPMTEALAKFMDDAANSPYPLMTKIGIWNQDENKEDVLLHLWCTQKFNSPFSRISELVKQKQKQQELLFQAMNELLKLQSDNTELLMQISETINSNKTD